MMQTLPLSLVRPAAIARAFRCSAFARAALQLENDALVLGIESSCDDTAAAVVDVGGRVRGEAVRSQLNDHRAAGGVVPNVAGELHRKYLEQVTSEALSACGVSVGELSAVAVATGPGLAPSLHAGLDFAKKLATKEISKPLLSVHHMEAHALTPRLEANIPFPYLVLLVSGGHCILAVAHGPSDFHLLGSTRDDAPGEAFDKVARSLCLDKHPEVHSLQGGAAIERLARDGDPTKYPFPTVMIHSRCCNFSFSGLKTAARSTIARVQTQSTPAHPRQQVPVQTVVSCDAPPAQWTESGPVSDCADIAASFQLAVSHHLVTRTHRAILYCRERIPGVRDLVVSGGVASNQFIRSQLQTLSSVYAFDLHCPPPHLCTDNGVMIAWAAIEYIKAGIAVPCDVRSLDFRPKWPLGKDISDTVKKANIKLPRIRL